MPTGLLRVGAQASGLEIGEAAEDLADPRTVDIGKGEPDLAAGVCVAFGGEHRARQGKDRGQGTWG